MKLASFFKLVEIQTKVASVVPLFLGTSYVLYRYDRFNLPNFLMFFASLLLIDMTTTALNNYFDWKRAKKRHGYNFEIHNSIEKYHLKENTVVATIIIMLAAAIILGLLIVSRTDLIVLAIGALSFAVGITYSYGPLPISRTPLGEAFSGFFMGFVILFLAVYIQIYDSGILSYSLNGWELLLRIGVKDLVCIFFVSLPLVLGISNIMLANNICDVEDDLENGRHTLPIYIGRKNAILLFNAKYFISYADVLILVLLGILPVLSILVLLTMIPVLKGIKLFNEVQTKKDTFVVAVKSFLMIGVVLALSVFVSWVFNI